VIIVEGPDGAGKSTLIENLGHIRVSLKSLRGGIGGAGHHNDQGWGDDPLVAYTRKIIDAEGSRIAYDRFHLSEIVYGPMLRGTQLISEPDLIMLTNYIRGKCIPVILCLPPVNVTIENVSREGRERPSYQTESFLRQAYKGFERLAPWATIVYDYTRDRIPTI
jgi:thymidylate kinase